MIREEGGSIRAVKKIAELAEKMCADAAKVCREEAQLSELILGTDAAVPIPPPDWRQTLL